MATAPTNLTITANASTWRLALMQAKSHSLRPELARLRMCFLPEEQQSVPAALARVFRPSHLLENLAFPSCQDKQSQ